MMDLGLGKTELTPDLAIGQFILFHQLQDLVLGDVKIGGQGRNVEIFHRAIRGGLGESMGVWGSRWEFGGVDGSSGRDPAW
jgi:hypothetical protein